MSVDFSLLRSLTARRLVPRSNPMGSSSGGKKEATGIRFIQTDAG